MAKKLTLKIIDGMKPKATRYDVPDGEAKGLVLRVSPDGSKAWCLRYRRPGGGSARYKLGDLAGMTPDQARKDAAKWLVEIRNGRDPVEEKRAERGQEGPMTLRKFLDGPYASFARLNLRSAQNVLDRLTAAFVGFLDKPLEEITPEGIHRWKAQRVSEALEDAGLKAGAATAHELEPFRAVGDRHIACLRSALSYAVVCGFLPTNPLKGEKGVKLQKTDPRKHIRPFTADEQKKLFDALDAREQRRRRELAELNAKRRERGKPELPPLGEHFCDYVKPLVTLLFATGLRRGEALKLQWRDVNLDAGTVTVRTENAKTRRERRIPLIRSAVETLRLWKAQTEAPFPESPVFTSSRHGGALGDVKKVWRNLLRDAKLPHLRIHDVRHTTATEALKRTDIAVVQKILGHAQITTTARYLHPDEDQMRSALEGMEDRRGNVVPLQVPAEATQ